MSTDLHSQAFVPGDWGTSRLRLSLIVGGEVAATRAGPGMVGSRNGGRTFHSQGAITVIGEQQLAALYRGVLAARARPADVFDGHACAIQGLLYLVDCLRGGQ